MAAKKEQWCNVRLTTEQYEELKRRQKETTCRKLSVYVRNVLFEKPVVIKQRDVTLDVFMEELIKMRNELNYLGNNFNQVVKKINSTPLDQLTTWRRSAEELQTQLIEKTAAIQATINVMSDKWLSRSTVETTFRGHSAITNKR